MATKRYSLEFKAKIILKYRPLQGKADKQEKSINFIASRTGIDRRTIGSWIKQGDKIIEMKRKRSRFTSKTRDRFMYLSINGNRTACKYS